MAFPDVSKIFQSTRPVRGATYRLCRRYVLDAFQSTRPVRGATSMTEAQRQAYEISIHAPRAGRDWRMSVILTAASNFNPRAPCGARRCCCSCRTLLQNFNPRAPCGARLQWTYARIATISNFNPRAPCGARPHNPALPRQKSRHFNPRAPCGARRSPDNQHFPTYKFQSTRPVRGATLTPLSQIPCCVISIHAPRAGRDEWPLPRPAPPWVFQSTRPVRGATYL